MDAAPGNVVIVGAGHAGGSVAAFLRQFGFAGAIALLGEEPLAPYQRPPLSKAWLKGEVGAEALLLKPHAWYAANGVDLRLEVAVVALDADAQRVRLSDGSEIGFDAAVLATGARARALPIPGVDAAGVLALRTAADAEALKARLRAGAQVAVIGGGYVGLEAAASARTLGAEVVVLERAERLLARVACEELSTFYLDLHRAHGVRVELGAEVRALETAGGAVVGVRLGDGRVLPCDVALVGVGAQPNDELARAAGLACEDGVLVDEHARTSHPAVYAAGDVTCRPLAHFAHRHRLESVPNALEQARQAAAAIVGRAAPPAETPWFWSDQYDVKLQIAGLPLDCDARVVRGERRGSSFAVFHLHAGRLRAVEAVNAAPEFMAGRQLIARGVEVDAARLADPAVSMKDLLRAA